MVFSMFKQPVNIKSIQIYFTDHSVQNQKWNNSTTIQVHACLDMTFRF